MTELIQIISSHPAYSAMMFLGTSLAAFAGIPRLVNAIREWHDRTRSRDLANALSASTGVSSLTSEDIVHSFRNYIEPNCTQTDPADEDDLRNVVALSELFKTIDSHFETGGEKRHVILLADSGMGKTSFCINFYAREQKKRPSKRRPVAIIPLGRGDAIEQIKAIPNKRESICFLDAFDEDPKAVVNPGERLISLMNHAADFRNIVITCRSQFFATDDHIPRGSGIMYAAPRKAGTSREFPLHRIFLAPFSKKQITKYLQKHFPYSSIKNWRHRRIAAGLVESVQELSARPMLLELLPDLVKEQRTIGQLFGLYEFLIEKWLNRENDWIEPNDLLSISIELAVSTFLKQRSGDGDRIAPEFLEDLASKHHTPLETWKLKSRSLLNRDIQGQYKFAHRSVMEHLFLRAALDGDARCLSVEWTDLMKDLFVSWGDSDSPDARRIAEHLFNRDLSATGLFPLASPLKQPHRRSAAECRDAIRADISLRHARRIPAVWRDMKLSVRRVAELGAITSFEIFDPTHGLTWLINDMSASFNQDERDLYKDAYDSRPVSTTARPQSISGASVTRRLPSIEELLTLWESEPHLRRSGAINSIFDHNEIYWLGDTTDQGPLCCSFGPEPITLPHIRLITTRTGTSNQCIHLYEFAGRHGFLNRAAYRAMCVYIAESSDASSEQSSVALAITEVPTFAAH